MYDSLKVERDDMKRHSNILHKEIKNFKRKVEIELSWEGKLSAQQNTLKQEIQELMKRSRVLLWFIFGPLS